MINKNNQKIEVTFFINKKDNKIINFNSQNNIFIFQYYNNKNNFYKKVIDRNTTNYFNIDNLILLNEKTKSLNNNELLDLKHKLNFSYILSNNNEKITTDKPKLLEINLKKLIGNNTKNMYYQKLLTFTNIKIYEKYIYVKH